MMGNLPNGAVRGLRPCCICDSMGRFNIKPCEPSGPYSDSQSRLDCCQLPSVCLAWQRGAKRRSTIPETGGASKSREPTHVYAGCRQTSVHTP